MIFCSLRDTLTLLWIWNQFTKNRAFSHHLMSVMLVSLWELNSFLMWMLSFVAMNLHSCRPHEVFKAFLCADEQKLPSYPSINFFRWWPTVGAGLERYRGLLRWPAEMAKRGHLLRTRKKSGSSGRVLLYAWRLQWLGENGPFFARKPRPVIG